MADSIIDIKHISKRFGEHIVLDDVSCHIEEGENLVLFGKSGTGKSVLLKCIVGLLTPDSGEIFVNGKNVLNFTFKELNSFRKEIGFPKS